MPLIELNVKAKQEDLFIKLTTMEQIRQKMTEGKLVELFLEGTVYGRLDPTVEYEDKKILPYLTDQQWEVKYHPKKSVVVFKVAHVKPAANTSLFMMIAKRNRKELMKSLQDLKDNGQLVDAFGVSLSWKVVETEDGEIHIV